MTPGDRPALFCSMQINLHLPVRSYILYMYQYNPEINACVGLNVRKLSLLVAQNLKL